MLAIDQCAIMMHFQVGGVVTHISDCLRGTENIIRQALDLAHKLGG